MAASLIQNAIQVNFDSVLSFPDEGMAQMFKALESTGLRGFLSCPSVLYEDDLLSLFAHSIFTDVFALPTEGLNSMDEVPKNLIYDARSVFSASGEPIKTSCKKKEMKIEFRLLNDIMAKSITFKAGSFDAVTHERFRLMTSIHCGLKINWSKILFEILKDMERRSLPTSEDPYSQNCWHLRCQKKSITAEEVTDETPVEIFVKKTAAKKRPALAAEPIMKRKRTTVGRAAPTEKNLAIVPVVQDPEPISVVPAEVALCGKVIAETAEIEMEETVETESRIDVSAITNDDAVFSSNVLSNEEGPLVEKEKETEKETTDKGKNVEKLIDSEDTDPLRKVLELTETSMSDEESMTIDDILRQIPEDMMQPSVTAEAHKDQIREALVKDIYSFFYSFSIRSFSALQSVSDLAAKEDMLQWAETYSLQTTVRRRLYIIAKYREMLLRKFLETRHNNFESGTPTSAIDLQVLDLLSEAHSMSVTRLLEQLKQHRLEWARPCSSKLFERAYVYSRGIHSRFYPSIKSTSWVRRFIFIDGSWTVVEGTDPWWRCGCRSAISRKKKQQLQRPFVDAFAPICIFIEPVQDLDSRKPYSGIVQRNWEEVCVDIVQFSLFVHLLSVRTYNLCRDIVEAGPVVDIDAVPTGMFNAIQHRIEVECLESIRPISPDSIPSSPSRMYFTDEIPQTSQFTVPPVVHPSTDFIGDIPQISMPTAVVPSADYTESFAQL
ncbi:hypothetical protein F511_38354 [Dorcoceras hygrometricum]|uniref:Uncharacterized protein n=1 Tax=Dorcoceras hygrometricum TaxID=472368 RepID=A0A2Z7AEN7_9LAMI|nr:hypothetical protein F511_38354 [Dorcoceras hygrometricum]